MCSPGRDSPLQSIARVLKPSGTLLFWEHGLAEDSNPKAQREQRFMEPIHNFVFPGCRLTRRIFDLVEQGGFTLSQQEREHFDFTGIWRWMAAAGYFYRGEARVSEKSNEASG